MIKRILVCVLAASAVFAASAKVCVWTGGSGKWSDAAKWEDGGKPVAGDIVDVRNDAADAVIENDISGLVLSQLFVTGSASCTLKGEGVTLTEGHAFSNGVAQTRCELPLNIDAQTPFCIPAVKWFSPVTFPPRKRRNLRSGIPGRELIRFR